MAEINLLFTTQKTVRDYDKRAREKTPEIIRLAKEFGKEFFDGDRKCGYGGYQYDGRWQAVARTMQDYYKLAEDAAILDIGCAKGFLLHDFKELMPQCTVAGGRCQRLCHRERHGVGQTFSPGRQCGTLALPGQKLRSRHFHQFHS